MMRSKQLAHVCLAAAMMVGVAAAAQAQDTTADGGKLKVTVEYKGQAGTVDKEHKIWVWLFDNPNISADSMPLAVGALSENKATYKFVALPKTVYIAAAFDNLGGYDGSSAPPASGTPITVVGATAPGTATAVPTGGDDATVTVTFDDTMKMP
jgi:uncharacterized protein (DUF2141 family)